MIDISGYKLKYFLFLLLILLRSITSFKHLHNIFKEDDKFIFIVLCFFDELFYLMCMTVGYLFIFLEGEQISG